MNNENQRPKAVGGLYLKTSKKGVDFLTGYVELNGEKVNLVVFKNTKKFSDTTPDYSMFVSQPMEQGSYQKPAQSAQRKPTVVDADDQIPF